jgi:hypothetical protein
MMSRDQVKMICSTKSSFVLLEMEHVDGRLAGVHARAGVGDHLDELGDRRDVDLVHLLGHHVRRQRAHAGQAAEQVGMCMPGCRRWRP